MKRIWNLPCVEFHPFPELADDRPILLVTSAPAWKAVSHLLTHSLQFTQMIEASDAALVRWDAHLRTMEYTGKEAPEVIYAIGGGLAVDEAKYLAARTALPLVCLPTALSVDAFFTWASGIRENGCVKYIETKPPDKVIIDLSVIAAAPPSIRAAGICDVLSISTGCWDWQYAEGQSQNPPGMQFIPWVYANAQSILQGALDCAEAAGAVDPEGLKQLIDCLCLEVQLCNQIGHSRPEEGSEHYFTYAVENIIGHGIPHGDLVGPGIILITQLQGQDNSHLEKALRSCHIPLYRIPAETTNKVLKLLPGFCVEHNLPFGIAHTLSDDIH